MSRFYTIPLVNPAGLNPGAGGRVGTVLELKDRANAGIVAPRSGTVNVYIIVSASQPNSNFQIYRGYNKGLGDYKEHWVPESGLVNISIEQDDFYKRILIFSGIQLTEGEFLAIRVTNRQEGYRFNLANIYMEYTQ